MQYTTRLKWVGGSYGSKSYGWIYLNNEACKWIGVKAGDRVKVVTCGNGDFKFLMVLPEEDTYEEKES